MPQEEAFNIIKSLELSAPAKGLEACGLRPASQQLSSVVSPPLK
jgi:hypothetical protein